MIWLVYREEVIMFPELTLGLRFRIATFPYGGFFLKQFDRLKSRIGAPIVIHGSYNTGNIGDLGIGIAIKDILYKDGIKSHLNGFINDKHNNIPDLKKYDIHIVGGGGVIRDYPHHYLQTRLKPVEYGGNKSVVMGVGVDGICTKKGRQIIKKLNKCEFITVRDKKSRDILQPFLDKKIEVASCPSFLISYEEPEILSKSNVVGINLRDIPKKSGSGWGRYFYYPDEIDLSETRKWYLSYLQKVLIPRLKEIAKEKKLLFIPFTLSDIEFARQALTDVRLNFMPLQDPKRTLSIIHQVDQMICMRYHSIVFSILARKPIFAISYHNKTKALLEELGRPVNFIDLSNPEAKNIEFKITKQQISEAKKEFIDSAKKNFQKLRGTLDVG